MREVIRMNNEIIKELVELGIYDSKNLSEEEYNNLLKSNTNSSLIYITGYYEGDNDDSNKYFKEIDTKGLTVEDIKLQLEIDKAKNIRSIKNMVMFFVVITVISLVVMFLGGMSLFSELGSKMY